ncbi:NfeD family protein [Methylotetracoccus oryzae]|uniref:NfeD family protein n=1 Tax=Methylotetracoccus oryzae TaxID=1919059 RepID=UPI00111A602B|nr:NfeD family protein [Methylotetracoccus oryzae]
MTLPIVFWHWWAAGALLLVVELLSPGMYFLWMAEAALLTGALLWAWPDLSWESQLLTFSVLSVASIVLARKLLTRHPIESDRPLLNRRAAQLVGRICVLPEPIVNGEGKIRIDDSMWRIRGADAPAGARIRIIGADGVMLRVEALDGEVRGEGQVRQATR